MASTCLKLPDVLAWLCAPVGHDGQLCALHPPCDHRGTVGQTAERAKLLLNRAVPTSTGPRPSAHPIGDVVNPDNPETDHQPAFLLVGAYVEPPAGIEPATLSLPWNHREPLCGPPFPQVTPDRKGRSYRFSFGQVMRSHT
jgi:hypothetical protein